MSDPRRAIPSIDRLLASEAFAPLIAAVPRSLVRDALEAVQDELRGALAKATRTAALGRASTDADANAPASSSVDAEWYARRVGERLEVRLRPSLRAVINATGVVLHTNLGRAPLPAAAREAILRVAGGYSNLEYDVEAGSRGSRYDHCAAILTELTGAESALVVNNNAAALVLALNTLARARDAVVSRGELVEIGGSFRVPEIMARSGARMREIGATNRTHRADYEAVVTAETGAILKVHRSNYRLVGFTAEVGVEELVSLGRAHGVPVIHDLGSGLIQDLTDLGLPYEPTARAVVATGVDVVTMSGDKLLGGPQAGIVLGRAEAIARMRRNPLCRAFRVDKLTLAALEATLALYRDPATARREIPTLRMLAAPREALERRAAALVDRLAAVGVAAETRAGASAVGGGAYPEAELPTTLVALSAVGKSPAEVERALRAGDPPVIARIVADRVVLDPRTLAPEEEPLLVERVRDAVG